MPRTPRPLRSPLGSTTGATTTRSGPSPWSRRSVPSWPALLRSEHLWLWEDSVLIKEPGSPFATRFHTDAGYFHLSGDQIATTWVPLDPSSPANGMVQWLRGSHRDTVEYRPNLFVTDEPIAGTEGDVVPDVLGTPELAERLISFELEPGDMTVHHALDAPRRPAEHLLGPAASGLGALLR